MKCLTSLFVASLLFFVSANARDHYQPVGNFTEAMNINILEVKVNGTDLEPGDEIGIFSGELCVGNAVLTQNLEGVFDALTKSAVAGADDTETADKDGFTIGGTIVYKFWDASEHAEIPVSEVKYYNPNNGNEISSFTFAVGATAYVSLNTQFNYTPKSNAGPDQIVHEGESGQLDGTGSLDINQDSLSFMWTDLDGFGLNELEVSSPRFKAPKIDADKDFRFVLVVSDGENESEPDTTIITVLNVASGPVANAGAEVVELTESETANLDGTNSFDPDGEQLTWYWELSDPGIELLNSETAIASFIAPEVKSDTTIYAYLTVTNTSGFSDRDTVQIKILNINLAPVAVVTSTNIQVQEGDTVTLDGSISHDPDSGPSELSYQWKSLNGGELFDSNKAYSIFTAPYLLSDSVFLVTLTVFDGDKYSLADTVAVSVSHQNLPPVAFAGPDLVVDEGTQVILDGSSSFDPEGGTLLFEWYSDYLSIDDLNASQPNFLAPEQQKDTTVEIILKVSDVELSSAWDTVWITIQNVNKAPVWISLPSDTAYLGRSYHGLIKVDDEDLYDTIQFTIQDLPSWLNFADNGDGTAVITADTIPYIDAFAGNWEFEIQASDGTLVIDTVLTLHVTFYTGISQPGLSDFIVYPNPAREWVTIRRGDSNPAEVRVRLYDTSGMLILEERLNQRELRLNLNGLCEGVYFLEILENGRRSEGQKLVIN